MYEIHVNYIAILVVGVFSFILGAVWYSPPLFAKQWMNAIDKTEEELKSGASAMTYVITFVVWIVATYVLAVFVHYSGASTFGYGMLAGRGVRTAPRPGMTTIGRASTNDLVLTRD